MLTHSHTHTTACSRGEQKIDAAEDLEGETVSGGECTERISAVSLLLVQLACVVTRMAAILFYALKIHCVPLTS